MTDVEKAQAIYNAARTAVYTAEWPQDRDAATALVILAKENLDKVKAAAITRKDSS